MTPERGHVEPPRQQSAQHQRRRAVDFRVECLRANKRQLVSDFLWRRRYDTGAIESEIALLQEVLS